jgi:hypothetical protein
VKPEFERDLHSAGSIGAGSFWSQQKNKTSQIKYIKTLHNILLCAAYVGLSIIQISESNTN